MSKLNRNEVYSNQFVLWSPWEMLRDKVIRYRRTLSFSANKRISKIDTFIRRSRPFTQSEARQKRFPNGDNVWLVNFFRLFIKLRINLWSMMNAMSAAFQRSRPSGWMCINGHSVDENIFVVMHARSICRHMKNTKFKNPKISIYTYGKQQSII